MPTTVAAFFLDELLRHGTTSALVFATVHPGSVDALFEAALARDMRIVSGKVLMDLGPEGLRDNVASGRAETEALIARWRGRGRLGYAVTPRFAPTSSREQLADAGELLAAHPDVLMHTHLSENPGEIAFVAERFPEAADYLDVYDRFGLVGPRSVFAHCVHMSDRALARMAEAGAGIAFCPTSNLFLGSGLFDLAAGRPPRRQARHRHRHRRRHQPLRAPHAGRGLQDLPAPRRQPRSLPRAPPRHRRRRAGHGHRRPGRRLLPGQEADFILLDDAATPLLARRCAGASLHDRLFALQVLGDDRAIAGTWLRGRRWAPLSHSPPRRGGAGGGGSAARE